MNRKTQIQLHLERAADAIVDAIRAAGESADVLSDDLNQLYAKTLGVAVSVPFTAGLLIEGAYKAGDYTVGVFRQAVAA